MVSASGRNHDRGLEDGHPIWRFDGLAYLGTAGCGIDWYIELNGPQPGTVWCNGDGGCYRSPGFADWFGQWIDGAEVGLEAYDTLCALKAGTLAWEGVLQQHQTPPRITDDRRVYLGGTGGYVQLDEAGRVVEVILPRPGMFDPC